MKHTALILFLAASTTAALAQTTPAKPAAPAASATHAAAASAGVKLPPGVPPARGILKTAFTLKYQDIKLGTGAEAEPNKMYKVQYTGWLGADGHKFDSSYDHPGPPLKDKDGKPVLGDDGKPKTGDPQPMSFPQGMGRLIPGFDQGFYGMKVGGKRRLFIPWQLAYGAKGRPGPDAAHPGIPPKADLIFDVELVDVTDMPAAPGRPGMPGGRPMPPGGYPGGKPPAPGTPGAPATPLKPITPGQTPPPGATPAPGTTPAPTTPGTTTITPGNAPQTPTTPPVTTPVPVTPAPTTPPAPATPPPTQPQSN
jgi:peptidylprolyl isomerase